jgi:hypothetical protein
MTKYSEESKIYAVSVSTSSHRHREPRTPESIAFQIRIFWAVFGYPGTPAWFEVRSAGTKWLGTKWQLLYQMFGLLLEGTCEHTPFCKHCQWEKVEYWILTGICQKHSHCQASTTAEWRGTRSELPDETRDLVMIRPPPNDLFSITPAVNLNPPMFLGESKRGSAVLFRYRTCRRNSYCRRASRQVIS